MDQGTSTISGKKITTCVSQYIWDSPCLKPIVYNPFILALVLLSLLWVMDYIYDKKFYQGCTSMMVQHLLTTYVIIASGLAMNNIIIKHHYRTERFQKKEGSAETEEPTETEEPIEPTELMSETDISVPSN